MTKIGDEINDILEELKSEHTYEESKPGDITSVDVMNALGISQTRARSILDDKVKVGKLIKVKVKKADGGWKNA